MKKALNIEKQIQLLEDRGVVFDNNQKQKKFCLMLAIIV